MLRRGKEKGKRGIVKAVFPKDGAATVEGLNVVKRHTKQGQDGSRTGRHLRKGSADSALRPAGHRPQDERADARAPHPAERRHHRARREARGEQLLVPAKAGK